MATNLYSLAGAGKSTPGSVAQNIGGSIGGLALPLTFLNPWAGAAAAGLGGVTSLIGGIAGRAEAEDIGRDRYNTAESEFQKKIAANPTKYSLQGITDLYNTAKSNVRQSNTANTNALLDRYSSIQRQQLKNKIQSGLTSGAAQAAAVQNNLAFQAQANNLFNQQASTLSNIALKEGQAKFQAADLIDARKDNLARTALTNAGITDPSALGGLTTKLIG